MPAKAIVVGAGIMGAATAHALTRRGHDVLLLERAEVGHKQGSSHGRSRIFRFSYPDVTYVRMAQKALTLWRKLEAATGEELLIPTGGFDLGRDVERNLDALRSCGAAAEMMTAQDVALRWSHLRVPKDALVMFSPDTAVVLAERALRAFIVQATRSNATLIENEPVVALDRAGAVETAAGTRHEGDAVVVTAGAWAGPLLRGAGIDLEVRPTRETIAYFDIREEPVPAVVEWGAPSIYALTSPGQGLKVGEHIAGPQADPNDAGGPDQDSVARLSQWVRERFPTVDPDPAHVETCFYTNTTDESFVLERHGSIVVGSPCSGHGFKFAPLVGESLADLVEST